MRRALGTNVRVGGRGLGHNKGTPEKRSALGVAQAHIGRRVGGHGQSFTSFAWEGEGGWGGGGVKGECMGGSWNAGLLHMCTRGSQYKSAERNLARQWPIRPEVPFCHKSETRRCPWAVH